VIGQQARKKKICQKQKKIGQNQKEKKSATNRHGRKKTKNIASGLGVGVKLKTDGINPVSSATVFRIFPFVFVFPGINGNGIENGTE
jgi:hypothetical protein